MSDTAKHPTMHRTAPTQQRIVRLKTATVPRLRKPEVKVKKDWDQRGQLEPRSVSAEVACALHHGATLAPGQDLGEAEGGDWAFAEKLQAAAPCR